jgi:hypothetical protein
MRRMVIGIGFCAMLATAQASNAQPENRAIVAKHQLSECMSRRMSESRTVSYNDAMRACKQQLQPPKETLAANPPGEAGSKAH